MVIGIIKYGAGNIRSVQNALARIGAESVVSSNPAELESADKLILPGVGEARSAMERLYETGMVSFLLRAQKPVLGICLGMQLLYGFSEERSTEGLDVIPGSVSLLSGTGVKIPHIGWNSVRIVRQSPLWEGISHRSTFYFVHSYAARVSADAIGVTTYGDSFTSAVQAGRIFGVQFHPEKSSAQGLKLLQNFVELC